MHFRALYDKGVELRENCPPAPACDGTFPPHRPLSDLDACAILLWEKPVAPDENRWPHRPFAQLDLGLTEEQ